MIHTTINTKRFNDIMPNRVIKDSIWSSPTLAKLTEFSDDNFAKWLLMQDDWGCFNSDSDVIKGLVYPKRPEKTPEAVQKIKEEYYQRGFLFLWQEGEREWGYFVAHESHNNYCNKTNVDDKGKHQKHRRKTPEPPAELLKKYLEGDRSFFPQPSTSLDTLEQVGTGPNKILEPNPKPKPDIPPSEGMPAGLLFEPLSDSDEIKPTESTAPDVVKPTGTSTSREVKPIESSTTGDVKPPNESGTPRKKTRTHARLEIFMEEYQRATGNEYVVGNYREEGGAAKNTVAKVECDLAYRQAVKAYLECDDKRIKEQGHSFYWFIRELNRWITKGKESIGARDKDKYAEIYE